jgi:hypothetical protein
LGENSPDLVALIGDEKPDKLIESEERKFRIKGSDS